MNPIIKSEAIKNLVGGNYHMNAYYSIEYLSGQTPPTEEALQAEIDRLEENYASQEYARNRATEYPAITDQLDEIYHNGIDSWKAVIKVTKDKYPKG